MAQVITSGRLAVQNPNSVLPHLRRCPPVCQPFTQVQRALRRPGRFSSGGYVHHGLSLRGSINAASTTGPVAFEHLLEVAERAAKAGAAVCPPPKHSNSVSPALESIITEGGSDTCPGVKAGLEHSVACQVVSERVDKPRNIEFKGATDLVTDTDKASEDAVLSVLRTAFPDHALLGEEGGISGDTGSEYLWCVDPLDGTTNFAHGYPSFAVSVAVLQKGDPVAGVVVEFAGGPGSWVTKTYTAAKGKGAFLNGSPISVSRCKDVNLSLLVTGFGYEHDEAWAANIELFKEFTDESRGVRRLGAAAVDLCHVALGIVDGYWEFRLKPWDMAAGVLIAREAGAKITTMDGQPFTVFSRSVLAANDGIHPAILEKTQVKTEGLMKSGIDMSPWFLPDGYQVSDISL